MTLTKKDTGETVTLAEGGKIYVTFAYPEGMDAGDQYKLLHWNGTNFDEPKLVKQDANGVVYELTSFSPYVLLAKDVAGTGGNTGAGNSDSDSADSSTTTSTSTPTLVETAATSPTSQQLVNVPQTADTFPMTMLLMAAAVCMFALGMTYGKSKKEI